MKKNRHTVDQIIVKLRRADVELGKGKKVPEICRLLEVTEQTYYRWRQKYVACDITHIVDLDPPSTTALNSCCSLSTNGCHAK